MVKALSRWERYVPLLPGPNRAGLITPILIPSDLLDIPQYQGSSIVACFYAILPRVRIREISFIKDKSQPLWNSF